MRMLSLSAVLLVAALPATGLAATARAEVPAPAVVAGDGAHPVATGVQSLPLAAPVGAAATGKTPAVLTKEIATKNFSTVGVTWAPAPTPPDLAVSVRTRDPKGSWSGWTELDTDDADNTDDPVRAAGLTAAQAAAKGLRGGTSGYWTGPSNGVQVKIVVEKGQLPQALRVELVDPGASTADAAPSGVRAGSAGQPMIYSRSAWGADESKVRNAPTYMSTVSAAIIHHTAGPNGYSRGAVPSIIRGDYAYHLQRGWSDIGYNALVDRFGRIWEGRAGGLDRNVMGAHAGGFNTDTFGVSMIGNYDRARPSRSSLEAVARIIAWKLDLNHRNPSGTTRLTSAGGGTARYARGATRTFDVVMGHRNTGYTACPGANLYAKLGWIRSRVKTLMGAALTNPSTSATTAPYGGGAAISARALRDQSWRLDVFSACTGARVDRIEGTVGAGRAFTAAWDGRTSDGARARPGEYRLLLTSSARGSTARPVGSDVVVLPPDVPAAPVATPVPGAGGFVPVRATRVLDTRGGDDLPIGPKARADVQVTGRGDVPAGVTAVVLTLTVTCTSGATSIDVWPTGGPRTGQGVTVVPPGVARSVTVVSPVSPDGKVSIVNGAGVANLTADVVGYVAPGGGRLRALATTRVLDTTRQPDGALDAGRSRVVPLPATLGGVDLAHVTAVVVDVSAVRPAGTGALSAYRTGGASAPATVPFSAGRPADNLAIVPVQDGGISLKALGARTDVTLDVRGIVVDAGTEGGQLTATAARPVLGTTEVSAGQPRSVTVVGGSTGVPQGATGVLVALTAVASKANTAVEVHQSSVVPGTGAALRVSKGDSRGNLVLVPVGSDGKVTVSVGAGSSGIRMEIRGYLS